MLFRSHQSTSAILYLESKYPQTSDFCRERISGQIFSIYKGAGSLFVTPAFFLHPTYQFQAPHSFFISYSLSLFWIYCYSCYYNMPSTQNAQPLPSFDLALQSDHQKTILPNLQYPYRSNAHAPWSGSSAPLLFAVSQTFLWCFLPVLLYA